MVHESVSPRKADNTTAANHANLVSPSQADRPLSIKSVSKVKIPVGVLPIPKIFEENVNGNKRQEDARKRDDIAAPPLPPRFAPVNAADNKEEKEEVVEAGNLDSPFVANPPAAGHHGEEIVDKKANNGAWFGVPGVQEVGEINQLGRVPG